MSSAMRASVAFSAVLVAVLFSCGDDWAVEDASPEATGPPTVAAVAPAITSTPGQMNAATAPPVPTDTPTASPTATATATAVPTATPTPSPTATPTATPTPVPADTPTPSPTATPTATYTPVPTATYTPVPTATPTPTPTATATATPTPTPTPTATPTPTPTPTATPTPDPAVRVIYAVPSDREVQDRYSEAIRHAIYHVQRWYAEQLGGVTFNIAGNVPQVCSLGQPSEHYEGEQGWSRVLSGLWDCEPAPRHSSPTYVWAIYIDAEFRCDGTSELGRGGGGVSIVHRGDLMGLVDPDNFEQCGFHPRGTYGWIGGLAHEVGHAFGLAHPEGCDEGLETCDHGALMWLGFYSDYPETYLTEQDVEILASSRFIYIQLE